MMRIAIITFLSLFLGKNVFSQNQVRFEFVQADKLYYRHSDGIKAANAFKGNVEFIAGDIYLYCDSVFFKEDKLECFGEVKVIKAGAYTITGNSIEIEQKKRIVLKGDLLVNKPKKEIRKKRFKLK